MEQYTDSRRVKKNTKHFHETLITQHHFLAEHLVDN